MEEIKTKGIVIKSVDYKDSDKLVTIFSAERGLIKARVRGVKKDKAKLAQLRGLNGHTANHNPVFCAVNGFTESQRCQ